MTHSKSPNRRSPSPNRKAKSLPNVNILPNRRRSPSPNRKAKFLPNVNILPLPKNISLQLPSKTNRFAQRLKTSPRLIAKDPNAKAKPTVLTLSSQKNKLASSGNKLPNARNSRPASPRSRPASPRSRPAIT